MSAMPKKFAPPPSRGLFSLDVNSMYAHSTTKIRLSNVPEFRVLSKERDHISKVTWNKLYSNHKMRELIINSGTENVNFQCVNEITGEEFYWVTEKFLTVLMIKGATILTE